MNPLTLVDALKQAKHLIQGDSARLDSEILLADVLKQDRSYLYTWPEKQLTPEQQESFFELVKLRQSGQPVAYLTGYKEFWGLTFQVNQHTLIPRPDTEVLVETTLSLLTASASKMPKVLDLGTGSGAIICALKSEMPYIDAYAVDYQSEALKVAIGNAQRLNLAIEFRQSNWFSAMNAQTFDFIVSNPPYIESDDIHLSQGDVRFEPITALTSGQQGLDDITHIIQQAKPHLNDQAWLILEHGYNQADDVKRLMNEAGYQNIQLIQDYNQNARVTLGQWIYKQ